MESDDRDPGAPDSEGGVVAALTRMIATELDVRLAEEDIDASVPLLEGGLMLDSMVLFELIALIEQRYQISLPSEDLNARNFASLNALSRHIVTLRERQGQT